MSNTKKSLLIVIGILVALVLVTWIAMRGSGTSTKKVEKNTGIDSVFSDRIPKNTPSAPEATTSLPAQTPSIAKKKLAELPLTAGIDLHYPELYLSHRWEAILRGSLDDDEDLADTYLSNSIAITELNDPTNSDLDPTTFTQLRTLAINVVQAEATGIGTAAFPEYFTPGMFIDSCTSFETVAAGAISMPYPNDSSWAMAIVSWKAQCKAGPNTAARTTTAQQTIYLHRDASGAFKAVSSDTIPRIPIEFGAGA